MVTAVFGAAGSIPGEVIQGLGGTTFWLALPEVILIFLACLYFLAAGFPGWVKRNQWGEWALAGLLIAGWTWFWIWTSTPWHNSSGLFRHDDLTYFLRGVGLGVGILLVLLSRWQVAEEQEAEYHACLLLMIAGLNLVVAANDLIALFLALELVSIPTYVLLYLTRQGPQAREATTKYFLLSIFSSALLLYGLSFLYGTVGSTNLEVLQKSLSQPALMRIEADLRLEQPPAVPPYTQALSLALIMILAGLGFRITAVPFHFYAPDVYQGVPTVCAAILSIVPKVAGFAALFQVINATLLVGGNDLPFSQHASGIVCILALASMVLGNLLGVLQDNLKRLLAYSGVAHAGYMLVGLGAGYPTNATLNGPTAMLFYLVVYIAMTAGAFACIIYLSQPERPVETVDDLAGLAKSHPWAAFMMAVFLFSLTGLPPTAGFLGKLWLIVAAWSTTKPLYQILAVFMAITAAIGAYYYLRIVTVMYLREPAKPLGPSRHTYQFAAMVCCTVVVLGLFIVPGAVWSLADKAAQPVARTAGPAEER